MGLFRIVPSKKDIDRIFKQVLKYSNDLKNIIITENCIDYSKFDISGLEYLTILYDLKMYKEVMQVKYSNKYIEVVIRTILYSLEDMQRKAGNNISKEYLTKLFINLSNYLNELARVANDQGEDIMMVTASHLCANELYMDEEDFENHFNLIVKITDHFNMIINLKKNEI
jgi:hypothetical protein